VSTYTNYASKAKYGGSDLSRAPEAEQLVKRWLAKRPRYQVHFTPTSSSWLNQIERWFAEIIRKQIRCGTFRNVRDLIKTINDYIRHYNKNPRPF
jgi:transposase